MESCAVYSTGESMPALRGFTLSVFTESFFTLSAAKRMRRAMVESVRRESLRSESLLSESAGNGSEMASAHVAIGVCSESAMVSFADSAAVWG